MTKLGNWITLPLFAILFLGSISFAIPPAAAPGELLIQNDNAGTNKVLSANRVHKSLGTDITVAQGDIIKGAKILYFTDSAFYNDNTQGRIGLYDQDNNLLGSSAVKNLPAKNSGNQLVEYLLSPSVTIGSGVTAVWIGVTHNLRTILEATTGGNAGTKDVTADSETFSTLPDPWVQDQITCSDCGWRYQLIIATPILINIDIDIKPGSDPNCFNNDGHGVIPVAILGSDTFDATTVDPITVTLDSQAVKAKGNGDPQTNIEDVNGDGFDDLIVKIIDEDGIYEQGTGTATLTGELFDGTSIEGTDSICITQ